MEFPPKPEIRLRDLKITTEDLDVAACDEANVHAQFPLRPCTVFIFNVPQDTNVHIKMYRLTIWREETKICIRKTVIFDMCELEEILHL